MEITIFTNDQQLYKVAVNVTGVYQDRFSLLIPRVTGVYQDRFSLLIPRLGGMHLLMSCIGSVGGGGGGLMVCPTCLQGNDFRRTSEP